ncbi:MAG: hypothetical protein EXR79_13925 [Myxococcales bacterium]|nr:hypothetical protein [Myxococcales bacterium]
MARGELDAALDLAERALGAFGRAGRPDAACAAHNLLGRILVRRGDPDGARAAFEAAVGLAQRHGLEARELSALTEIATLHESQDELRDAIALHRGVLERQRLRQDSIGIAVAAGNVGRLLPRLVPGLKGPEAVALESDARTLLDEAGRRFAAAGNLAGAINALVCVGDLERGAGKLQEAEMAFASAVRLADLPALRPLLANALLNLGHAQRDRGDAQAAQRAFVRSAQAAQGAGDAVGVARARLAETMLRADHEPPASVLEAFAAVERMFDAVGQRSGTLAARVNRAALLARCGHLDAARAALESASLAFTQLGDLRADADVRLACAEVAVSQGDVADAARHVAVVRARLGTAPDGRLGLRLALTDVRAALRALQLDRAAACLEDCGRTEPSAAESFAIARASCEIAAWRLLPTTSEQLARLAAVADQAGALRDTACVALATASYALWCGHLDAIDGPLVRAVATFAQFAEPLSLATCQVLAAWRTLLVGRPPTVLNLAATAQVPALAARARTVAALARWQQDSSCAGASAVEAEVAALDALGDHAAALELLVVGARLTRAPALYAEALRRLAVARLPVPGLLTAVDA